MTLTQSSYSNICVWISSKLDLRSKKICFVALRDWPKISHLKKKHYICDKCAPKSQQIEEKIRCFMYTNIHFKQLKASNIMLDISWSFSCNCIVPLYKSEYRNGSSSSGRFDLPILEIFNHRGQTCFWIWGQISFHVKLLLVNGTGEMFFSFSYL